VLDEIKEVSIMKKNLVCALVLSSMAFASASTALAEDADNQSAVISNPVLALQSSSRFSQIAEQAKAAFPKHDKEVFAGLSRDRFLILGYTQSEGKLVVSVGTTNKGWPTMVVKTGEIRADYRIFPDGVNGILIEGATYTEQEKVSLWPARPDSK
jgi:hypothetical protein